MTKNIQVPQIQQVEIVPELNIESYKSAKLKEMHERYISTFDELLGRRRTMSEEVGNVAFTLSRYQHSWGHTLDGRGGTTDTKKDLIIEGAAGDIPHILKFSHTGNHGDDYMEVGLEIGKRDEGINIQSMFGELMNMRAVPVEIKGKIEKQIYPNPRKKQEGKQMLAIGIGVLEMLKVQEDKK